jgi:hypothetical protein
VLRRHFLNTHIILCFRRICKLKEPQHTVSAANTLIDRSWLPLMISPSPAQRKQVTDSVCPDSVSTHCCKRTSQMRTVQSFDELAMRVHSGSLQGESVPVNDKKGSCQAYKCNGCQASPVIHCL